MFLALCLAHVLRAENSRITERINDSHRTVLAGHVNRRVQSAADQGRVDPSFTLPHVMLVLKPSASQQADLDQLLEQQQDPSSPNYNQWLTPEEYADRFGISQADVNKITAWLGRQNLTVQSVARARNAIAFSGNASLVESALGTEIHRYLVNGELHYANATDPSVPAALQDVVRAIQGLHDFRLKPHLRAMQPRENLGGEHQLAPDDIATIYDITPLYNAGFTGKGQTLVVAGQTRISLTDIEQYRLSFGLSANDPQTILVPNTRDPGTSKDDLGEADLDLELSGAVARDATILYVYSYNVMDAVQYAIDQNLAPVITVSYGECEAQAGTDKALLAGWASQAAALGITWFAASGDSGGADCFDPTSSDPANNVESIDLPAGVPNVTGVGGTEFNEGGGSYWNTQNSATHASALSYIPEIAWNDSAFDGSPSASGGGVSTYFVKPSWQTATGVPDDGFRDVPDVSLSASADHDGYAIYSSGTTQVIGGTSAGPPQFAGIATLLNQYLVANSYQSSVGLGNMNPRLYALASTSGVFHDVTSGNNIVTPCASQRNCTATPVGYNAGVGYDLVTGLGTVDVYNLVTAWHVNGGISKGAVKLSVTTSAASLAFTGSTVLTASVASTNGGTPTGTVAFSTGNFALGTANLAGSNGTAVVTLTLGGVQLAAGANSISAVYSGDTFYNGATGTINVTITSSAAGPPSVKGTSNGASFTSSVAPGGLLSVFGLQLASATGSAASTPLPKMLAGTWVTINGITAPLYYVSPTQLNVQIPYEVPAGTATITVHNNTQSSTASFTVSSTAPGIFTFNNGAPVPYTTAARGQEIVLYMTDAGAVSPSIADGGAPAAGTALANLPAPVGAVKVTVGGSTAGLNFVGMPTWAVGVIQINYTIPSSAPLGAQQVIVSVAGVPSAATTLTITQ